jgi:bifunctional NMN adenylyltransferase/nudix hydrolase
MSKPYSALVLIGRFQPFHNAHLEIIKRATALTDNLVIITGSANQPRTYKNPFTSAEREQMIKSATGGLTLNIHIESNPDTIYNDQAWAVRVQAIVQKHTVPPRLNGSIAIIGHKKDDSSFYLDMFPQWDYVDVEEIEPLSAVNIRDLYFKRDVNMNFIKAVVPQTTFVYLDAFKDTPEYEQIIRERELQEAICLFAIPTNLLYC